MCWLISVCARSIACSGDSVPASAAFTWVPRIDSTADHSVVRGRQKGGASSEPAMAVKNGYRLTSAGSLRIDFRNGIPPASAYGFWISLLVAQVMNRKAHSFSFAAFGMARSQLPIIGVWRPGGPAGMGAYPTLPITLLSCGFSTMSEASAGQTVAWAAWPVARSRVRSAASVVSAPGCATDFSCPTKNLSAFTDASDLKTTFQLSSKTRPPNAVRMGYHCEMIGLHLAPRIANP